MIEILDEIENEKKTAKNKDDEEIESYDALEDGRDWQSDDPDEDIIHIK